MVGSRDFFNERQQREIAEEIKKAESQTSAEIRVHLEEHCDRDPFERAKEIFTKIGMHKTRLKNGILIYLCIKGKKFAIIGDAGIDKVLVPDYWGNLAAGIERHFKEGGFCEGICFAIRELAGFLKKYFPHLKTDTNEIPDKLSF